MSLIFRHLGPETSGGHVLMLTNSEYMSVKHWFTTLPASLLLLWTMYRRVQMIQMWLVVVLLFHTHILNPLLLLWAQWHVHLTEERLTRQWRV